MPTNKLYSSGLQQPDKAITNAYNAGYFVAMTLIQTSTKLPTNQILDSFKAGFIHAYQYRYQETLSKTCKRLKLEISATRKLLERLSS